ncbi:FmdE family protein [Desulfobulbus elongatus]|uniref:FmdE family protein n=1 Tax=Desulfobulbus elongatus TaxID=53332 RepID=UPI00047F018F|nr:FmdE family protein [Desulfobulbus elongatus]
MQTPSFGTYEELVEQAGQFHGDICHGIKIGTRMTMAGLRRIGITDPKGADRKKLMVFVEIDRCTTDAIMALTGCRPGKRTMKIRDYGKMAATFINLETNTAFRVVVKGNRKQGENGGEEPDFATLPEEELFTINEVAVPLRPEDMPGKPLSRVPCARCGETVMDGREVRDGERVLCVPCSAAVDYYRITD